MSPETKFKDVAHLYLGCKLKGLSSPGILSLEVYKYLSENVTEFEKYKPPLRPLSDMKIEEGAWCLQETFFDHVRYPISDFRINFVGQQNKNPCISIDNDWFTESLTFGCSTGSIWAVDRNSASVKIKATLFVYLLKQGFDLFGLILSGQAESVSLGPSIK
jgi:hypothetical protein